MPDSRDPREGVRLLTIKIRSTMRRISIIAMVWVCASVTLEAQNEIQALRYSRHNPFGTARFASQGGAIGALGGDLTAVQVNPAGLGFYRATEYSFTPSFYWVNTTSEYMGITADDSRFRFNVGSTGFVAAHNSKRKSGFVGGAFAFGYNTLVNFNNSMTIRGLNNQSRCWMILPGMQNWIQAT
jgi:hypothetical protein